MAILEQVQDRSFVKKELIPPKVRLFFERLNINPDQLDRETLDRFELLAESGFLDYEQNGIEICRSVFRWYEVTAPEKKFSNTEQQETEIGFAISDIGKTGPIWAASEQKKLIISMFKEKNIDETITVAEFFQKYFKPESAAWAQIELFMSMNLDPSMTMRQFYDRHSEWTFDIALNEKSFPLNAVGAAAAHHYVQGINPHNIIIRAGGQIKIRFKDREFTYDRPEKLLTLADKYDGLRTRSGYDHATVIEILRLVISKSDFANDEEFVGLLHVIDILGQQDLLPYREEAAAAPFRHRDALNLYK